MQRLKEEVHSNNQSNIPTKYVLSANDSPRFFSDSEEPLRDADIQLINMKQVGTINKYIRSTT